MEALGGGPVALGGGGTAMRRGLGFLFVLALLLPATPALPDTTVVVRSMSAPADAPYGIAALGCNDLNGFVPPPDGVRLLINRGPDTPPAGERTWGFDLPTTGSAVGTQLWVESMAGTTVAGMSLHTVTDASGVAYALYQAPADNNTQIYWIGRTLLTQPAGGWRPVDVAGLPYAWTRYDFETNMPASGTPVASATVAQMVTAKGGDGDGGFLMGFGCDGDLFYMDAWRVGSSADLTTYDLEGGITIAGISGSAPRIIAGRSVGLTGTLTDTEGTIYSNHQLILEAKGYGSSVFTPVGEATTTDSGGPATTSVSPMQRTVYRWRFEESEAAHGDVSPTFTVEVLTKVTAQLRDSTKRIGQDLVVDGRTTPKKPGVTATLWRRTANGPVRLDTTTIRADGTYTARKTLGKAGKWNVYVTVPALSGNLAGKSPIRTATVTR